MRALIHDHGCELIKGLVGVLASSLSVLTSLQENVEHIARVGALLGGMTVSILTGISIIRGWRKKRK